MLQYEQLGTSVQHQLHKNGITRFKCDIGIIGIHLFICLG